MERIDAKLIIAFARSNMVVVDTGLKVGCSRNTVIYHFEKIRKATGLDPRNFFDLGELYEIARNTLGDDFEII